MHEISMELIFSIAAVIIAFISLVTALYVGKKQIWAALLEKRIEVIDAYEQFVFRELESWEWNGSMQTVSRYSLVQLISLFSESDIKELYDRTKRDSSIINKLHGDIEYAKRHDTCQGRDIEQIEDEISDQIEQLQNYFINQKDVLYKKWIKWHFI